MVPWLFARRVPFTPQMEATECGAACLAMVLAYHRCWVSLSDLRVACRVSRDGATLFDVATAAEQYGLQAQGFQAEIDDLQEVSLPAILHWGFNHFVVLERVHDKGADLVDPAAGRRTVPLHELDRSFTGVVLQLAPGPTFARRDRPRRTTAIYRNLWQGAKAPVVVTVMSAFVLETIGLIFPSATALIVDFVVRPKQTRLIPVLAVVFFLAVVLRSATTIARSRVLGGIEARLEVELSATLVKHVLGLPVAFFSQRGPGDLLNRVSALLSARETIAQLLSASFDVLLVLLYGALMLLYDWRLGGVVITLEALSAAGAIVGRRQARAAATARRVASSLAQSALVQAFADPETTKAFGAEALLAARYGAARAREINSGIEGQRTLEPSRQALSLLNATGMALIFWLGGRALMEDRMTLGVLSSFLALQTLLSAPLDRVIASLQGLSDVGPLLDRVDDVLGTEPEASGSYVPERLEGAISFENVSFRYGTKGPLLLDRVSFVVKPGERVAIAGPSGAGKSTILKLVLGFVSPLSGIIRVDGRDIREYDIEALRSSIGTVLAGGAFFDESVFDNVTLGAPRATADETRRALEAACVDDVVDALAHGPLTQLGTGARRLSGGQRQRLLLARALVKRPSILLLDEASSALDTELERRVQADLAQMRCTMIIVAHRLSAVAFADRILFLDKGRLVQEGSVAALTREPGPFRELVRVTESPSA